MYSLGFAIFFAHTLIFFPEISAPLTKLPQKCSLYMGVVLPTAAMAAIQVLKIALTSDPLVAFPSSNRVFALIIDASTGTATVERGLGAILAQVDKQGAFHMISYGTYQLVKHEKKFAFFIRNGCSSMGM